MHHDSKSSKEEAAGSCLFVIDNLERTPNRPSVRSLVDLVSFVVSSGKDWVRPALRVRPASIDALQRLRHRRPRAHPPHRRHRPGLL